MSKATRFIMISLGITVLCCMALVVTNVLYLDGKLQNSREEANKLRLERDMYAKLYRTANARITQFNDSIKIHCICK